MEGVRQFYEGAVQYILAKFPMWDDLLHARFINFTNRDTAKFSDVEYFIGRYGSLLNFTAQQLDAVHEEFVAYQLLHESDIPSDS